ncbi:Hypothetical Protein FCC1311_060232 [Hondaea fermentalgiana]|uniref:Uncharacterized protein n=1 Tax=Hondaea fermentalgiana TaxID=2315210 RepID=A0A2R5GME0_9STRA|nr:Hypothetical Protein FCC1311_060232 [Hondaea fermentalgiana]|eukprot:GBG29803.1 Hypothetical Protein FCC1311_060232 [Hondaea fermentalgiana]
MDLRSVLCSCMPQLVALSEADDPDASTRTPRETLEHWERVMCEEISINFDSEYFYLQAHPTGPSAAAAAAAGESDCMLGPLRVRLDGRCPLELIRAIKFLVLYDQMNQQIKNVAYRIHFREYMHAVQLENDTDDVRISVFLALAARLGHVPIEEFFLSRITALRQDVAIGGYTSRENKGNSLPDPNAPVVVQSEPSDDALDAANARIERKRGEGAPDVDLELPRAPLVEKEKDEDEETASSVESASEADYDADVE